MKIDKQRIYYNAVFGAIGGVIGWALISIGLRLSTNNFFTLLLKDALLGAIIGVAIGAAMGSIEGLIFNRSSRKTIQGIGYGGVIGLIAGAIGLIIGEIIFSFTGGGVLPRAIGWAIFGALVGSSDGWANRMPSKIWFGILGGLLGGLVGGSTYERLNLFLRSSTGNRETAVAVGGAIGLLILGASIGAIIGLVSELLTPARFRFLRGKLEGQTRMLDPKQTEIIVGSYDGCDLYIPGDRDIQAQHARIMVQNGEFTIAPIGQNNVHLIQNHQPQAVTAYTMQTGDVIQLGRSRFVFEKVAGGK